MKQVDFKKNMKTPLYYAERIFEESLGLDSSLIDDPGLKKDLKGFLKEDPVFYKKIMIALEGIFDTRIGNILEEYEKVD